MDDVSTRATLDYFLIRRRHLLLSTLLVAAFLVRLFSITLLDVVPASDALEYHLLAKSLIAGQGFSLFGLPTSYRPPGFPFFLAGIYYITHTSLFAAQVVQAALEILHCFLLYVLGKRIFSPSIGLIAAAFWASYPTSVIQSNFLYAESLFGCVFLASLIMMLSRSLRKKAMCIGLGVLVGWGTLIKPFFLLAPILLALWLYWNKTSFKEIAQICTLVVLSMSAVLAPWIIRNVNVFQRAMIVTNGGINLWIGNNENSSGGYRFDENNNPFVGITDEVKRDAIGYSLAWHFITSRPLDFGLLIPRKIAHLFSSDSPLIVHLANRPPTGSPVGYATLYVTTPVALHLCVNVHYMFFILMGILGFLYSPAAIRHEIWLLLLFIGFWIAVHSIFFGTHRFRYPSMPLFVLASAYITMQWEQIKAKAERWKTIAFIFLAMGFCSILTAEVLTALARAYG